jgi:hypothetical protein
MEDENTSVGFFVLGSQPDIASGMLSYKGIKVHKIFERKNM